MGKSPNIYPAPLRSLVAAAPAQRAVSGSPPNRLNRFRCASGVLPAAQRRSYFPGQACRKDRTARTLAHTCPEQHAV